MDDTVNGPIINGYGGIAFETNGTNERLRIDSSGRLLLGSGAVANPKSSGAGSIDLDNQAFSIMVGGNHPSGGRSNNNAKTFRMSMVHYALAEEPINILQGYCDSSDNNVYIGGGTGSANSLTSVRIYTGANTTTTGGTERFRIHSAGQIGLSGANYGSAGQVLTSQGSSSAVQWTTPSSVTTTSGTMTIGFQDHTSGNTSSTTATGRYERIGNMVHCSIDTGAINISGLQGGQILLVTGCFPITRDNNWHIAGSTYHYNVNTGANGGGHQVVAAKGYWLSNTSMYFVIPRNNSTSDNLTVNMMSGNTARFFMNYSYKVN